MAAIVGLMLVLGVVRTVTRRGRRRALAQRSEADPAEDARPPTAPTTSPAPRAPLSTALIPPTVNEVGMPSHARASAIIGAGTFSQYRRGCCAPSCSSR